ncbi:MAG: hypothetical protein ACYC6R_03260 [Anaerolineales bacterium]
MKKYFVGFLLLILTACATTQTTESVALLTITTASLPDLGLAPELTNESWLNVDTPLRLVDLRGKVVAIEMWTFG